MQPGAILIGVAIIIAGTLMPDPEKGEAESTPAPEPPKGDDEGKPPKGENAQGESEESSEKSGNSTGLAN